MIEAGRRLLVDRVLDARTVATVAGRDRACTRSGVVVVMVHARNGVDDEG